MLAALSLLVHQSAFALMDTEILHSPYYNSTTTNCCVILKLHGQYVLTLYYTQDDCQLWTS